MINKKEMITITKDDLESLFPFFILVIVGLIRLYLSKKKKKTSKANPTPPPLSTSQSKQDPITKLPISAPSRESFIKKTSNQVDKSSSAVSKNTDEAIRKNRDLTVPKDPLSKYARFSVEDKKEKDYFFRTEKKATRIQTLISSSGSKRKIILLLEILKNRSF